MLNPYQGLATAFGQPAPWPPTSDAAHHQYGMWNCQDDGFYRFVYHLVRDAEGPAWLTNDRTPEQLLRWWQAYLKSSDTSKPQPA